MLVAGGPLLLALLALLGLALEPDPRGHGTHERLGLQPCLPMERWALPRLRPRR